MFKSSLVALVLVVGVFAAQESRAQVSVFAPGVNVQVGGGGVFVRAPGVVVGTRLPPARVIVPAPVFYGPRARFRYPAPHYRRPVWRAGRWVW